MNTFRIRPPAGLFRLSPVSLLVLSSAMASAQTTTTAGQEGIEEVVVRSSPLRSGIDEVVLGTTVMDRAELLQNMNGTIG
ncbi:MAG: hypothetical protein HRT56_06620, partial [Coraliomargarita sp.]|nr:hypothetical protein [Coraliomargarita sp.]